MEQKKGIKEKVNDMVNGIDPLLGLNCKSLPESEKREEIETTNYDVTNTDSNNDINTDININRSLTDFLKEAYKNGETDYKICDCTTDEHKKCLVCKNIIDNEHKNHLSYTTEQEIPSIRAVCDKKECLSTFKNLYKKLKEKDKENEINFYTFKEDKDGVAGCPCRDEIHRCCSICYQNVRHFYEMHYIKMDGELADEARKSCCANILCAKLFITPEN